jgi:hypothetical protein
MSSHCVEEEDLTKKAPQEEPEDDPYADVPCTD